MRKFPAPILLALTVLLFSPTEGWSLSPCSGSPSQYYWKAKKWTNFVGTHTWFGDKYVGEWRNGKYNGKGTLTYADGRVKKEYGRMDSPLLQGLTDMEKGEISADLKNTLKYGVNSS